MIPITVVAWSKEHWLLWMDGLKEDIAKLINSKKAEENNIHLLRSFSAGICLKENHPQTIWNLES